MASKYWIKLYHEILHDPKMGRLSDRLYRRCVEMFLLAGETDEEGTLPPIEDMAWTLRTDPAELARELEALASAGIVYCEDGEWTVTHFATRQAPISDAERMARYRERQRKAQYNGDESVTALSQERSDVVTNRNVEVDVDTDTEVEVESPATDSDPGNSQNAPHNTDGLSALLFRNVENAGIMLNQTIADRYKALLPDILKLPDPAAFIEAAFEEARASNARPLPPWVASVVKRCLAQGCMPGEWSDNGHGKPRASPDPPKPKRFRNPITGEWEDVPPRKDDP